MYILEFREHVARRVVLLYEFKHQLPFSPVSLIAYETLCQHFLQVKILVNQVKH